MAKIIYIAFYKLNPERLTRREYFWFKVESFIDGCYIRNSPFQHVEFVVHDEEDPEDLVSYGINKFDERIHAVKNKTFSNPGYYEPLILGFRIDPQRYTNCISFLNRKMRNWERFDVDFANHFIPFYNCFIERTEDTWFCSKLVAKLLSIAGILEIEDFYISPDQLFRLIKNIGEKLSISNVRKYEFL